MENLWRDLMKIFTAPERIHRRNIHPLWSSELAQTMTIFIKNRRSKANFAPTWYARADSNRWPSA